MKPDMENFMPQVVLLNCFVNLRKARLRKQFFQKTLEKRIFPQIWHEELFKLPVSCSRIHLSKHVIGIFHDSNKGFDSWKMDRCRLYGVRFPQRLEVRNGYLNTIQFADLRRFV